MKYYADQAELKKQIMGVLTYPIFVFAITLGLVYFMMTSVVPMFSDVFRAVWSGVATIDKKDREHLQQLSNLCCCVHCSDIGHCSWGLFAKKPGVVQKDHDRSCVENTKSRAVDSHHLYGAFHAVNAVVAVIQNTIGEIIGTHFSK